MTSIFANKEVASKAYVMIALAAILFGIEMLNLLLGHSLTSFGILPRDMIGLTGIITSPFIHGSMAHFLSNIFAFVVLGSLIIWRGVSHFYKVSLFIMILTGFLVWILSPPALIVGSSGVIFGYFGYIMGDAFFTRHVTSILIALGVGFYYGSMIFGVIPGTPGVSWESHLIGFVIGIFAAWIWKESKNKAIGET